MNDDKFADQATRTLEAAWDSSDDMTPVFHILRDRHRGNPAAVRYCDEVLTHGVTACGAILAYGRQLVDPTLAVRLVEGEYKVAGESV